MKYGYIACLCMLAHTRMTMTIMYCGIQECHGHSAGQLVCFSFNTDSISEMTNGNLLLFLPSANAGVMSEWTGTVAGSVLWWVACCCWHSSTHYFLKGWRLFALLLKNYSHHLGRVESFPFSLGVLAQHSCCNHYCNTRWSVVPPSTWKPGCETNELIMMKSNIYKTEFTHYNQLLTHVMWFSFPVFSGCAIK